jgi:hypothetical protein
MKCPLVDGGFQGGEREVSTLAMGPWGSPEAPQVVIERPHVRMVRTRLNAWDAPQPEVSNRGAQRAPLASGIVIPIGYYNTLLARSARHDSRTPKDV